MFPLNYSWWNAPWGYAEMPAIIKQNTFIFIYTHIVFRLHPNKTCKNRVELLLSISSRNAREWPELELGLNNKYPLHIYQAV
jgi:hypothetical protein